jgi:GGDEF domain-containing protein
LKREIASAKRDQRELAVLAFSLRSAGFGRVAEFQEALIQIAFALRTGLRGGDFFARISDNGFWVLLRTDEVNARTIIERLDLPRHDALQSQIVARKYDEYAEWIERIDDIYFT